MSRRDQQATKFVVLGLVLCLMLGVALAAFFMISSSETSVMTVTDGMSTVTTTSNDSSFPWVIFIPIFTGALLPIFMAARRDRPEAQTKAKRKAKPKRKPQYIKSVDGELLEVVREDDQRGELV